MSYQIHLIVENEDEVICELSTSAGIADLEENVIRKAEKAIAKYEADKEVEMQRVIDEQKERDPDEEYDRYRDESK